MTSKYRIRGRLYLPIGQTLATYLNASPGELLRIADPMLYRPGLTHPPVSDELQMVAGFLALHQSQVLWLVGGQDEARPDWEKVTARRMAFLFENYLLIGDLTISTGLRSSDYLRGAKPFQTLANAMLYPWDTPRDRALLFNKTMTTVTEVRHHPQPATPVVDVAAAATFPFVTVNLTQAIGVLEPPQAKLDQPRYHLIK